MAPKAKARTLIVRLISTAQTGFFYTTQRLRQGPKLSAVKYDPKVFNPWEPAHHVYGASSFKAPLSWIPPEPILSKK
ncbi:54S ribosomal protein L39, mitochondrial [Hypsizygus marmoreus]|uniref:Large ribosomal subunit protein bL33m n=1 Tax=Hypsizygus marmoreus TaxID=39966 RepID=A0A369K5R7_HYPMA|nr:54S ribosomal protein L39, mitochondrial [Hypsizygus marmoreus]